MTGIFWLVSVTNLLDNIGLSRAPTLLATLMPIIVVKNICTLTLPVC